MIKRLLNLPGGWNTCHLNVLTNNNYAYDKFNLLDIKNNKIINYHTEVSLLSVVCTVDTVKLVGLESPLSVTRRISSSSVGIILGGFSLEGSRRLRCFSCAWCFSFCGVRFGEDLLLLLKDFNSFALKYEIKNNFLISHNSHVDQLNICFILQFITLHFSS